VTAPLIRETSNLVFDVRDVTFQYDGVTALDGLTLSIRSGERCALLGANGSGKSTLLRILDGLDDPQEGSVLFCGSPLNQERLLDEQSALEFRRRVGFVFQDPDVQLFSPTVFDELAFGPLQLRWTKEATLHRVSEMLDSMEIAHLRNRSPHQLSMGEKKRVALASVLILEPEILLLDEPTAALDPRSESHMIEFLMNCKNSGRTVITASHDLGVAREIADWCCIFESGRVAGEGEPSAVLADDALLERANLVRFRRNAV
jgi:cobalt/nickel transport system ATP-binding protein